MKFRFNFQITAAIIFALCCLCISATHAQQEEQGFDVKHIYNPSLSKPDDTFLQLKEGYNLAIKKEDKRLQVELLSKMGTLCFHLGHFAQALEYQLEAKKLLELTKNDTLLAANYNELGNLYYYNRDINTSRKYHNEALKLYAQAKHNSGVAATLGLIGHSFEKKEQYDSALYYQRKALQHYASVTDQNGEAGIYENLGSIYEDLAVNDSAMHYFRKALTLYDATSNERKKIEVYNNIGDVYRKTGQYNDALSYTRQALAMALAQEEQYQISSAYRDLSRTYHLTGHNDSAFIYAEIARTKLLDIYSAEGNKQMSFLQTLYDVEKKNTMISSLENSRRVTTVIIIAAVLIVVLLAVLGFVFISRQRVRTKAAQSISENERQILTTRSRLLEAELKTQKLEEEALKARLKNEELEQEKMAAELKNASLEEQQLKEQIETRTKELSTRALHVIQKNKVLETLKEELELMVKDDKRDHKKQLRHIIQQINQSFNNDGYWQEFRTSFEQVHHSFFEHLNRICPNLSAAELRLVSLLKMNLNSQEIATMLSISPDSLRVSRYRLRKKLNLEQGDSLTAYLQSIQQS